MNTWLDALLQRVNLHDREEDFMTRRERPRPDANDIRPGYGKVRLEFLSGIAPNHDVGEIVGLARGGVVAWGEGVEGFQIGDEVFFDLRRILLLPCGIKGWLPTCICPEGAIWAVDTERNKELDDLNDKWVKENAFTETR